VAGSRVASETEDAVPKLLPVAIDLGHGQENAGISSIWTLAAAARAVGATKTLGSISMKLQLFIMHSSEPVFAILNQEVEQDIQHVDVIFCYIFMYLPTFKLMMLVSN
jgi:hypothetical protein